MQGDGVLGPNMSVSLKGCGTGTDAGGLCPPADPIQAQQPTGDGLQAPLPQGLGACDISYTLLHPKMSPMSLPNVVSVSWRCLASTKIHVLFDGLGGQDVLTKVQGLVVIQVVELGHIQVCEEQLPRRIGKGSVAPMTSKGFGGTQDPKITQLTHFPSPGTPLSCVFHLQSHPNTSIPTYSNSAQSNPFIPSQLNSIHPIPTHPSHPVPSHP